MKQHVKAIGKFLFSVVVTFLLVLGVKIAVDGCWLIFLPIDDNVETVTIESPDLSSEVKEITDASDLKKCTALLNTLKYDIFQRSDDTSDPLIIYTFHLKDGSELVVSANNETVFFRGKQHVLKEPDVFVNLTTVLFFLRETAE